jgi:hypothetical protein
MVSRLMLPQFEFASPEEYWPYAAVETGIKLQRQDVINQLDPFHCDD